MIDDDVDEVCRFIYKLGALLDQGSEDYEAYVGNLPEQERRLKLLGWGLVYVLNEFEPSPDHVLRFFEILCSNASVIQKRNLVVATLSSCLIYNIESRLTGSPLIYFSRLMFISKTVALREFVSQECIREVVAQELAMNFSQHIQDIGLQAFE